MKIAIANPGTGDYIEGALGGYQYDSLTTAQAAMLNTAQAAGLSASSFSFNAGDGRCGHCLGLGYERVEMQFLSDVFVPCPVCDGRRFVPEVLAISWRDRSVADLPAGVADLIQSHSLYRRANGTVSA